MQLSSFFQFRFLSLFFLKKKLTSHISLLGLLPQTFLGVAEGGLKRRDPAVTRIARGGFTFDSLVEVAGEDGSAKLRAQVADEQQERDANRPPLGTLVVDVNIGDGEIGARLVG